MTYTNGWGSCTSLDTGSNTVCKGKKSLISARNFTRPQEVAVAILQAGIHDIINIHYY